MKIIGAYDGDVNLKSSRKRIWPLKQRRKAGLSVLLAA